MHPGQAGTSSTGTYISVANQNELVAAEVAVERDRYSRFPERQLTELTEVFIGLGADHEAAAKVACAISRDPEAAVRFHLREGLGVDPCALPSPVARGIASLGSFVLRGLVPLLPFLLGGEAVGRMTGRRTLVSGLRRLAIGALAVGVACVLGRLAGGIA